METLREEKTSLSSPTTPSLIQPAEIKRLGLRPRGSATNHRGTGRVRADLGRFGPGQTIPPLALDEAFAYCRNLAREHYENFTVSSWLAPSRIRPHLASIYAYCRWSDDLADEMDDTDQSKQLLTWWRGQLEECFRGRATHPVFLALRQTEKEYQLTEEPFQDLLSAFLQDQSQTRYESDVDLLDYCARSANPVGRLIVKLARLTSAQSIAWSDSICTGLQLANFCQDIRLDAERGRVYWPAERWTRWDVDPDRLAFDEPSTIACQGVMEWTSHARGYLTGGFPLVKCGPLWFARSVQLFIRGGLLILRNIDAKGGDVWSHDITVTRKQKIQLMLRAILLPRSTKLTSMESL